MIDVRYPAAGRFVDRRSVKVSSMGIAVNRVPDIFRTWQKAGNTYLLAVTPLHLLYTTIQSLQGPVTHARTEKRLPSVWISNKCTYWTRIRDLLLQFNTDASLVNNISNHTLSLVLILKSHELGDIDVITYHWREIRST